MFIPLGLDETQSSEQLLIDLTTHVARRGDVAHKGFRAITALPDPKEEKILAERIIISLKDFEILAASIFRSEEHTSELQSLMRISYAVFCLKKKINTPSTNKQYPSPS